MIRLAAAFTLFAFAAQAAPPAGADLNSPTSKWVRSLTKRSTGAGCCDYSDCRKVTVRVAPNGGVEVFIGTKEFGETAPDAWLPIPQYVLDDTKADGPAPDGGNYVCWFASRIYCAYLSELY